jgi:hypothetical protein
MHRAFLAFINEMDHRSVCIMLHQDAELWSNQPHKQGVEYPHQMSERQQLAVEEEEEEKAEEKEEEKQEDDWVEEEEDNQTTPVGQQDLQMVQLSRTGAGMRVVMGHLGTTMNKLSGRMTSIDNPQLGRYGSSNETRSIFHAQFGRVVLSIGHIVHWSAQVYFLKTCTTH